MLLWWIVDENVEAKTYTSSRQKTDNGNLHPPEWLPTQRSIKTARHNRSTPPVCRNESWPFVRPVVIRLSVPSLWVQYGSIQDNTAQEPSHSSPCLLRHDLVMPRNGAVSSCEVYPSSMADLVFDDASPSSILWHIHCHSCCPQRLHVAVPVYNNSSKQSRLSHSQFEKAERLVGSFSPQYSNRSTQIGPQTFGICHP